MRKDEIHDRGNRKAQGFGDAEWQSRVDCAAGHHLLELYGLTDMVEGVLATRVAGEDDACLLKTYQTFFDEVRASELVKTGFDETPDAGPGRPLNYSSCAQAIGMLSARADINCMLHTHIPAATVVASLDGGLQAVVQHALIIYNDIVYVDLDIGNDDSAVADIVAAMGRRKIALIRNHGVFIAAPSVAEVIFLTITLEYACRCQLDAMQSGAGYKVIDHQTAERLSHEFTSDPNNRLAFDGSLQWPGWLRKLDRQNSVYRD